MEKTQLITHETRAQYGVMTENPEKFKIVKYKNAMKFVNLLISKDG